jgi:SAM-dependent methyltransferase
MCEFSYKPEDPEGIQTLEAIAQADQFNRWMYETIRPWCSGSIIEIGSGIGNISSYFLKSQQKIMLTDLRPLFCAALEHKFEADASCLGIQTLDLVHTQFDEVYASLLGRFDTAFALNVIEHIQDDRQALLNLQKLLKPGGRMIILVPAFNTLYNRFDKELHHYRRYTHTTLSEVMPSGQRMLYSSYFNAAGIAGWWFMGGVLKKKIIPGSSMKIYNQLLPVIRLMDKVTHTFLGLSHIQVWEKSI